MRWPQSMPGRTAGTRVWAGEGRSGRGPYSHFERCCRRQNAFVRCRTAVRECQALGDVHAATGQPQARARPGLSVDRCASRLNIAPPQTRPLTEEQLALSLFQGLHHRIGGLVQLKQRLLALLVDAPAEAEAAGREGRRGRARGRARAGVGARIRGAWWAGLDRAGEKWGFCGGRGPARGARRPPTAHLAPARSRAPRAPLLLAPRGGAGGPDCRVNRRVVTDCPPVALHVTASPPACPPACPPARQPRPATRARRGREPPQPAAP